MSTQRNSHRIIPGLYLGNLRAATATRGLTEHGITHILSVCNDHIPAEVPESGIRHGRIEVEDNYYTDLLIRLPAAIVFIHEALALPGRNILVHCDTGNSRSATVVAAYLMWFHGLSAADALDTVRRVRDTINVPMHFHRQLVLYAMTEYNPTPNNIVYSNWRKDIDAQLRIGAGRKG